MNNLSLKEIQLGMATVLFFIGAVALLVGILVLVIRSGNKELKTLAKQTNHLVQKGLAEDVSGLVGNATVLLNATNDLIRTSAGIGVFLTLLGLALMAVASWLVLNIP